MSDERQDASEPTRADDLKDDRDAYPKLLLERLPTAFYIADIGETGAWHYVSPQIEAILGYTPEEWRADPLLWRRLVHPADLEQVLAAEAQAGVDETAAPVDEYRMFHRDGHVVWIRDDGALVRDSAGRLRWHGVLSDISEQKRTEAELERRAAQQAAVARLGERALERVGIAELIEQACVVATDVLEVELASVAEFFPDQELFRLIGGAGWPADQIGAATVPAGPTTQVGYTILTGAPVVVTDWEAEDRFTESKVLELGA